MALVPIADMLVPLYIILISGSIIRILATKMSLSNAIEKSATTVEDPSILHAPVTVKNAIIAPVPTSRQNVSVVPQNVKKPIPNR